MPTALKSACPGSQETSSSAYRNYALLLLTLTYIVNNVDRNVLIILIEPIKAEMLLTDTQIGFLAGTAFAIFYAIMGVPLGILADRANRRNIVAVTLAMFSGMTFLCGLAVNFIQLLAVRIVLAVGEAGTTPSAHSMISDLFAPGNRAKAIAVYSLGPNVGILIGFLAGGWVSQMYGWRMAFFIVGLPGFLLAGLLYLTLNEPRRGQQDSVESEDTASIGIPFRDVVKLILQQRSLRHLLAGVAIYALSTFALATWFPSYLIRSFDMNPGEAGTAMAISLGLVGAIGTYLSGHLGDYLGRRDVRWYLWIAAISWLITFPALTSIYLSTSKWLALALFSIPCMTFTFFLAPTITMLHSLVKVRMRAQASAIFLLILTIVGQGVGPQLAGWLSDLYAPRFGNESLRYALLTVSVFPLWGALHYFLAARTLENDLTRVKRSAPIP